MIFCVYFRSLFICLTLFHFLSFWKSIAKSTWHRSSADLPWLIMKMSLIKPPRALFCVSEALSATRYASNKSVVNDVDGWELLILHKR